MSTLNLRRLTLVHWTAQVALLIAAFTAARWLFQWEFVTFIPGLRDTGIVSSTLLLALAAAAAVMAGWQGGVAPSKKASQRFLVLAWAMAVMPVLMLFEAISGISLGIDFTRAPTRATAAHPHPGRMSPNACVTFLLLTGALATLAGPVTKKALRLSALLIGLALLVSLAGLLGYLLHLEVLYRWASFNRFTLPVAAGQSLMAVAFWQQRQDWSGDRRREDLHEQRITRRSMGVLAVVVIAAGAGGFAALESDFERARAESIRSTAIVAGDAFSATLDAGIWLAETVSTQPVVIDQLARIAASPDDPALRERLNLTTQGLLTGDVTAARFLAPSGRTLAEAGRFTETRGTLTLALSTSYAVATRLFLAEGFVLHTERPVVDRGEVVGHFVTEQRLTLMDRLVTRIRDSEASADVLICNRVADVAACLPSKLAPESFTVPMFDAAGRVELPISRALLGESGVVLAPDLRDVPVVAAFQPLARTGLALVAKTDIDDVFSVIRKRLGALVLLLLVLVLAGTWALRRHVRPLVRQLSASEQRMRDVANAMPAMLAAFDAEERCTFANDLALRVNDLTREQGLGATMRDAIGEAGYALHEPHVRAVLQGQRQMFEGSLPWRGGQRHFQVHLVPMRDPQTDAVSGFYLMTFDVTELRRAQLKQERSERRLRSITDNVPALISHLDADGRYLFANQQFEHLLGVRPDELLSRPIGDVHDRHHVDQIAPRLAEALTGRTVVFESQIGRSGSAPRQYQQTYVPELDADGRIVGVFAVTFDITDRKLAEQRVSDAQAHLQAIANNLPVLISYIDREHRLTYANRTYKDWIGLDPETVAGMHLEKLIGADLYVQRAGHINKALGGERVEFEIVSQALGIQRHLQTIYIPDRTEDGSVRGIYALSTDITIMKDAERRLEELARNDTLTGLPNRREFEARLAEALARSRRSHKPMGLIFMDVDHFKHINDGHGHAAGDAVLKTFARRIRAAVRGTDTAARLAGDEFVVILEGLQDADEAALVAAKLVDVIREPMQLPGGEQIVVTTSIGMACWGGTGDGAEDILDRADRALYRAKAAGRNTFAQTVF